jgi:hypothetical protein
VRVDPRAEALGCFLCALRAIGTHTRKSPNYRNGRSRPLEMGYFRRFSGF